MSILQASGAKHLKVNQLLTMLADDEAQCSVR